MAARSGHQYAGQPFQNMLKASGINGSMSRKGHGWDNAPSKSWFNSFKNEQVHELRNAIRAEITAASFEYMEMFYNYATTLDAGLQVTDAVSG